MAEYDAPTVEAGYHAQHARHARWHRRRREITADLLGAQFLNAVYTEQTADDTDEPAPKRRRTASPCEPPDNYRVQLEPVDNWCTVRSMRLWKRTETWWPEAPVPQSDYLCNSARTARLDDLPHVTYELHCPHIHRDAVILRDYDPGMPVEQRHNSACGVCPEWVSLDNNDSFGDTTVSHFNAMALVVRDSTFSYFMGGILCLFEGLLRLVTPLPLLCELYDDYCPSNMLAASTERTPVVEDDTVTAIVATTLDTKQTVGMHTIIHQYPEILQEISSHLTESELVAMCGTCRAVRIIIYARSEWRQVNELAISFGAYISHITSTHKTDEYDKPMRMPVELANQVTPTTFCRQDERSTCSRELQKILVFNTTNDHEQLVLRSYADVGNLEHGKRVTLGLGLPLPDDFVLTATCVIVQLGMRLAMRLLYSAGARCTRLAECLYRGRASLGLCTAGLQVEALVHVRNNVQQKFGNFLVAESMPIAFAVICRNADTIITASLHAAVKSSWSTYAITEPARANAAALCACVKTCTNPIQFDTDRINDKFSGRFRRMMPSGMISAKCLIQMYTRHACRKRVHKTMRPWMWLPGVSTERFLEKVAQGNHPAFPGASLFYSFHHAKMDHTHRLAFAQEEYVRIAGKLTPHALHAILANGFVIGPPRQREDTA